MSLVQIKNIFFEKKKFSVEFSLFCHQFFHRYKAFNFNSRRNELNLQKETKKCTQTLKRYHVLNKKLLRRADKMANIKKENIENMVTRSD